MNLKIYVILTICIFKSLWAQGSYLRIFEGKNLYTQESMNQQQESTKICRSKDLYVDLRIEKLKN